MDTTTPVNTQVPEPVTDLRPYSATAGAHHVFKDVYSFFGTNVQNSVAIYVGTTNWKQDLQLLESYAFPTVFCDPLSEHDEWRTAVIEKRGKLMDWMKYLKESDCGSHFVNPKWIEPLVSYPGNFSGNRDILDLDDQPMGSVPVFTWTQLLAKAASLRNKNPDKEAPEPHFAVCKIELYGEETQVLASLLATQYRPSLIYLRWSESPDESQAHCEAAGHLQSCGYRLISINSSGFFLYHFSGQDIYSCASWLNIGLRHPLITQMQEQVTEFLKSKEPVVATSQDESPAS